MRTCWTVAALGLFVMIGVPALSSRAAVLAPLGRPPVPERPTLPAKLAPVADALRKGDPETALRLARDFAKDAPGSAQGHELLGAAALAAHQWDEAERALNTALKIEPGRPGALAMLGQLALERNDPRAAEGWFRQALAHAPRLGLAYRGLAAASFRKASRTRPSPPPNEPCPPPAGRTWTQNTSSPRSITSWGGPPKPSRSWTRCWEPRSPRRRATRRP